MEHSDKSSSALIVSAAKADARRSVSKLRWGTLGFCLSFLAGINVVALCPTVLFAYLLIPKIDLSTSEKVRVYSQHPALYTAEYRKTAKKVRVMNILCGWGFGIICIVFFYLF